MVFAVIIGLIAGIATTIQTSINTEARKFFRSPFVIAGINFTVAWLSLAAFLLFTEHRVYVPLGTIAENPPWIWLGGVFAVIIVTLNIACLPKLGAAGNVMIINFGQIVTGLVIDHFALFGSEQARMDLMKFLGAALVMAGMMLVTLEKKSGTEVAAEGASGPAMKETPGGAAQEGFPLLYAILAFICGIACSAQIAVNGTLRTVLDSVSKATLISMSVAFLTICALILVLFLLKGKRGVFDPEDSSRPAFRPWMVIGGFFALTVVSGNAAAAPVIGTGLSTIMNLIGMMGGGLVIDAVGFLGIEKKPVTLRKLTGMLLMLAGTAMISFM